MVAEGKLQVGLRRPPLPNLPQADRAIIKALSSTNQAASKVFCRDSRQFLCRLQSAEWRRPCTKQPDAVRTARSTSTTIAQRRQRSALGPCAGSCGGRPPGLLWPWLALSPALGEGGHFQGARSAGSNRLTSLCSDKRRCQRCSKLLRQLGLKAAIPRRLPPRWARSPPVSATVLSPRRPCVSSMATPPPGSLTSRLTPWCFRRTLPTCRRSCASVRRIAYR